MLAVSFLKRRNFDEVQTKVRVVRTKVRGILLSTREYLLIRARYLIVDTSSDYTTTCTRHSIRGFLGLLRPGMMNEPVMDLKLVPNTIFAFSTTVVLA